MRPQGKTREGQREHRCHSLSPPADIEPATAAAPLLRADAAVIHTHAHNCRETNRRLGPLSVGRYWRRHLTEKPGTIPDTN